MLAESPLIPPIVVTAIVTVAGHDEQLVLGDFGWCQRHMLEIG
jgi:hypothetical protein